MTAAGATATDGRRLLDCTIAETAQGVEAMAPMADTPATQVQLLTHLRNQLNRAQAAVQSARQDDAVLSTRIRGAADTYRGTSALADVQPVDYKRDLGGGPIPPIMPNPYATPNCGAGKVIGLQGKVALGALEIYGSIVGATSIVGLIVLPFGVHGGWERIVHAKDEYNGCLGDDNQ